MFNCNPRNGGSSLFFQYLLPQLLAVVAYEHHHRVVCQPLLLHGGQDPPDLVVHEADSSVESSPHLPDLAVGICDIGLANVWYASPLS